MNYSNYLKEIIRDKGILSSAYSVFHNYSIGNQLMAASQLNGRGVELSPIASYKKWRELGRQVKKGAKAIELIMPVTVKDKNDADKMRSFFIAKRNWFTLNDTEGIDYQHEVKIPAWDKNAALLALDIKQVNFEKLNGNCQGYAVDKKIAVNPLAILPHKTTFHEIAHIVLGHTLENNLMSDSDITPRDIREVEAESVAYILCSLLNLKGLEESRGYIQNWLSGGDIPDKSAQKIFNCADKILKAGAITE